MAKSFPYLGLEVTILGISCAKREGVFASRGKRDACHGSGSSLNHTHNPNVKSHTAFEGW